MWTYIATGFLIGKGEALIFVTWRLADALPEKAIQKISAERERWRLCHPKPWTAQIAAEYRRRFILPLEEKLDAGHGACVLRKQKLADIVTQAFHFFDGERYELDCFVVMPNHVHVLFALKEKNRLESVVQSWKSFTSKEINQRLGLSGKLWQRGYWDRLIRSVKHLNWTRRYIEGNPKFLPEDEFIFWTRKRRPPA